MAPESLTPDRILEATEEVLRRYGPAKATVVDVARALGVSHGSVYRHFRTKVALREAVTERWLDQAHDILEEIATRSGPAAERLDDWLLALFRAKVHKATSDPELFATYLVLANEHSDVVGRHVDTLTGQLARIVGDGHEQGVFTGPDADHAATARAVFEATAHWHDPVYAAEWTDPDAEPRFAAVRALIQRGLRGA